jgi:hypothetical protein
MVLQVCCRGFVPERFPAEESTEEGWFGDDGWFCAHFSWQQGAFSFADLGLICHVASPPRLRVCRKGAIASAAGVAIRSIPCADKPIELIIAPS